MSELARRPRADSAHTRTCILDAAEQLFSARGYSGTSLRAIADQAGVNLAAANYHFGSKAQLLEAALQRCVAPVNDERLARLDALEADGQAPAPEAIVRAFVEPVVRAAATNSVPQLLARVFAEPQDVSVPLLKRTFAEVAQRFFAALHVALPGIDEQTLQWRFHLLVGCLVHLANFDRPLNLFGAGTSPPEARMGVEQLVRFVMAGLTQGVAHE